MTTYTNEEVREDLKFSHGIDLKPNQVAFAKKALEVESQVMAELNFYSANGKPAHVVEDDGSLHITRTGLRACFHIGQDYTAREFNKQAHEIMNLLGIPRSQQVGVLG